MSAEESSAAHDPRFSTVHLPAGPWLSVLDALAARFPGVARQEWRDRIRRGRVRDAAGLAVAADTRPVPGMCLRYCREVRDEAPVPFAETILHQDADLLVADKPHFLAVAPAGRHVEETLLRRLIRRTGIVDLAPLHRIDRLTAGLVLFSTNPRSRGAYQGLFRARAVEKRYLAIAPALGGMRFPCVRRSRLVRGTPFFRMQEAEGAANSETGIDVLDASGADWRYVLYPRTGRKHQLRVHMAALGAPIANDPWYPVLRADRDDHAQPLRLLAQRLAFVDPLDGRRRVFESALDL